MDFLLNLLKVGAPIVGSFFGPIGTAVGGLASGLIDSFQGQQAAQAAENRLNQAAGNAQAMVSNLMSQLSGAGPIKSLVRSGLDVAGGKLAASGLTGSSLASRAYQNVLTQATAQLAPSIMGNMVQATNLGLQPYHWLFNAYQGGAEQAAKGGGIDLGFLADLAPFIGSMFGGGGGGGNTLSAFGNRKVAIPGGY